MKIVLDTNVLVSAIFWKGPPHRILTLWHEDRFELLISPPILDEHGRVVEELHAKFPKVEVRSILDLITLNSCLVQPGSRPLPACDDPNDVMFLAAAVAGRARYLVSGDRALLRVGVYPGGRIVTPREFLDRIG